MGNLLCKLWTFVLQALTQALDAASDLLGKIVGVVVKVAKEVVDGAVDLIVGGVKAVGSGLSSLFNVKGLLGLAAVGGLAWWFLSSDDADEATSTSNNNVNQSNEGER